MTEYVCAEGHRRDSHKTQSEGHTQRAVCRECTSPIVERVVPVRECDDCGHSWAYTGNADLPTCPACKGKRTEQVGEA